MQKTMKIEIYIESSDTSDQEQVRKYCFLISEELHGYIERILDYINQSLKVTSDVKTNIDENQEPESVSTVDEENEKRFGYGELQRQIYEYLKSKGAEGASPKEIGEYLSVNRYTVFVILQRMLKSGKVKKIGYGIYCAQEVQEDKNDVEKKECEIQKKQVTRRKLREITEEDIKFVYENYPTMSVLEIARRLNLTRFQVMRIIDELKEAGVELVRVKNKYKHWVQSFLQRHPEYLKSPEIRHRIM